MGASFLFLVGSGASTARLAAAAAFFDSAAKFLGFGDAVAGFLAAPTCFFETDHFDSSLNDPEVPFAFHLEKCDEFDGALHLNVEHRYSFLDDTQKPDKRIVLLKKSKP